MRTVLHLFVRSFVGWQQRKATVYAAAIAYSALFSLAPLLIVCIGVAGLAVNASVIEEQLIGRIRLQAGPEVANLVSEILSARFGFQPSGRITLLGVGLLLFGASGIFRQLRGAINAMWLIEVRPDSMQRTIIGVIKNYVVSAAAVLLLGLVPIVLLFVSTVLASLPAYEFIPYYDNTWLAAAIRVIASPLFVFLLFAIVLKYLPRASAPWRAILPAALLSALGYWLGTIVLAWYVQNAAIRTIYGAAGSALAVLIWAYYSATILLFGASFVRSIAETYGLAIVPDSEATFVRLDYDRTE